jgi:hypothetical protein
MPSSSVPLFQRTLRLEGVAFHQPVEGVHGTTLNGRVGGRVCIEASGRHAFLSRRRVRRRHHPSRPDPDARLTQSRTFVQVDDRTLVRCAVPPLVAS